MKKISHFVLKLLRHSGYSYYLVEWAQVTLKRWEIFFKKSGLLTISELFYHSLPLTLYLRSLASEGRTCNIEKKVQMHLS